MRKITFYISTAFVGANYETVVKVPDDTDDSELCKMAEDFMHDNIYYGWDEDTDEEEEEEY